jgi:3-hydroxyisobutyrate dehydrogenase-like beta-hydroxyacid dehydrogenase
MGSVAWLGTGLLGSGFVEGLRARGERVRVWNRTASKAEALASAGAEVASSPRAAAEGVERVHLCLSDDAAVDAVIDALGALPPGVPILDHTTVTPAGARARQARLAARGQGFLACPVFMAPANARAAGGIMLVGGEPALVERWLPALSAMTGKVMQYGADAGVPATIKLVGNAMIISMTAALTDAMTVAEASGVPLAQALELFQHFQVGGVVQGRGQRILARNFAPSFELSMARKDVRLMIETAGPRPLGVLPGLAARMDALIAAGHGQEDLAVLALDVNRHSARDEG